MSRGDSTEIKIKEAARKIMLKKGFDGARMQEIADEAGVNKAMLNYYYRSKKALFIVVFLEEFAKLFQNIVKVLIQDKPLEDKIKEFVETELTHLLEVPQLPGFVMNELQRNPTLIQENIKEFPVSNLINSFKLKYEADIEKGIIRDVPFFQFLISLQSLCIFPIIAKPIFMQLTHSSEEDFEKLIIERKQLVTDILTSYMILK